MFYSIPTAGRKSSEIIARSTDDWRAWWAIEARRAGTDWQHLLDAADAVLCWLRAAHSSEDRS
jgi:hypothetical protein